VDTKFKQLSELGAADFAHINGSLIDHLKGTRDLLSSWSAPPALQDAGLYHAAYGTAGFEERMVAANQREKSLKSLALRLRRLFINIAPAIATIFGLSLGLSSTPNFAIDSPWKPISLSYKQLKTFAN